MPKQPKFIVNVFIKSFGYICQPSYLYNSVLEEKRINLQQNVRAQIRERE